jgi:hypothetical protein
MVEDGYEVDKLMTPPTGSSRLAQFSLASGWTTEPVAAILSLTGVFRPIWVLIVSSVLPGAVRYRRGYLPLRTQPRAGDPRFRLGGDMLHGLDDRVPVTVGRRCFLHLYSLVSDH